jgi:hypothetical protein
MVNHKSGNALSSEVSDKAEQYDFALRAMAESTLLIDLYQQSIIYFNHYFECGVQELSRWNGGNMFNLLTGTETMLTSVMSQSNTAKVEVNPKTIDIELVVKLLMKASSCPPAYRFRYLKCQGDRVCRSTLGQVVCGSGRKSIL